MIKTAKGLLYVDVYLQIFVAIFICIIFFYILYNTPILDNSSLKYLARTESIQKKYFFSGTSNLENIYELQQEDVLFRLESIDGNILYTTNTTCEHKNLLQIIRFGYYQNKISKFVYGYCYD